MSPTVYIALGSNLGSRQDNLRKALQELPTTIQLLAASPIYSTPPWGYTGQPEFLNQVARLETDLGPLELLRALKDLEIRLGRQPTFRYGPRLIDLDILFYDDQVVDSPALTIPHPRLAERAFVLVPLVDLAPTLRHPVLRLTTSELLARLDRSGIRLYTPPQTSTQRSA
jgi:2-amino-4-hydroxy-6-hydroxymethyldihydropteridine diphosphokinase